MTNWYPRNWKVGYGPGCVNSPERVVWNLQLSDEIVLYSQISSLNRSYNAIANPKIKRKRPNLGDIPRSFGLELDELNRDWDLVKLTLSSLESGN